ncbi:hypothetical protein AWZ03_002603 [Drosophila navojoa]|uniref:Methyltransferase domain-containing protein n=1 Tax=Drosophila navojoa TaxID=7232 RepID=A0A484BQB0_DRONA|nr:hypothetical protein AWZ03_002603 [Drosophila navojoa]
MSKRHRLSSTTELLTSVEQLDQLLNAQMQTQLNIKEFMSAKKCHEVELTAALINKLVKSIIDDTNCYIVDAGDGKGYLSSRLSLEYGLSVLGIDANESNTKNALSRDSKLQRAWNGLTERAEILNQGKTPPRRGKKSSIKEHFKDELQVVDPCICLTGLHTCGNLAATCLQVFHAQNNCRVLCNVGCCYHLLNERYSEQEFFGNKALMKQSTDFGFPMSRYLQERKVKLGRNARMLAAQSIERTLSAKELPNISLYYRALLEVLVCSHAPDLKNSLQKLNASWLAEVKEDELEALLQKYESDKHYLSLFYLLRMSFAPVVESLILLDRLLYLKELGYTHSYLIDLFDAVISPRHYACYFRLANCRYVRSEVNQIISYKIFTRLYDLSQGQFAL